MKRISMLSALCAVVGTGLIVGAVAVGQRPGVNPQAAALVAQNGRAAFSNLTQGFSEIVTVSKAGDAVWLWSVQTGHWHKQAIPADQGQPHPIVGIGVVAFRTRSMVYACSSQTGAWDSVELAEGDAGHPTVGKNTVAFRAANKLYGFSSETGFWDSVELAEGDAGHPTVGGIGAWLEAGSKIYAFSPKTGNWAVVDREKP